MNTSKPALLSCGEVLWDLFPEGPRLGGAPANFACHAAQLGGAVSFLTAVGDDARGAEAVEILQGFGVDTSLVQTISGTTTGAVDVRFDAGHKPHYRIHPHSSWDHLDWTPALAARVATVDAIYFGTLGQRSATARATMRRALATAKERGLPRVLDINLRAPFYTAEIIRDSIVAASILKISDEELPEVARACGLDDTAPVEKILRDLRARFSLDLVALTRGPHGALLATRDEVIDQPGIPTEVVDTVGAGDSFTAALTLSLLRGENPRATARRACETAAAVCAHAGAMPMEPRAKTD
jgi:fructokinase